MEINLEKCNDIKIIDPHWFTQCIGIKVRFLNFIGWLISNIAYILRDDGTILRYIYIYIQRCLHSERLHWWLPRVGNVWFWNGMFDFKRFYERK